MKHDKLPETRENLQFPGGDITGEQVNAGAALISELQACETDRERRQCLSFLRIDSLSSWKARRDNDSLWNNTLLPTAETWGAAQMPEAANDGTRLFTMNLKQSIGFLQQSQVLPLDFDDFGEELATMSSLDQRTQQDINNQAWQGMQTSHPKLHGLMATFSQVCAETYEVDTTNDSQRTLQQFGIVLPYLLAATTRMNMYLTEELSHDSVVGTLE